MIFLDSSYIKGLILKNDDYNLIKSEYLKGLVNNPFFFRFFAKKLFSYQQSILTNYYFIYNKYVTVIFVLKIKYKKILSKLEYSLVVHIFKQFCRLFVPMDIIESAVKMVQDVFSFVCDVIEFNFSVAFHFKMAFNQF